MTHEDNRIPTQVQNSIRWLLSYIADPGHYIHPGNVQDQSHHHMLEVLNYLESPALSNDAIPLLVRLREMGWGVAIHNDYKLDGVPMTFWLFTKRIRDDLVALKGEGLTDESALQSIMDGAGWYM